MQEKRNFFNFTKGDYFATGYLFATNILDSFTTLQAFAQGKHEAYTLQQFLTQGGNPLPLILLKFAGVLAAEGAYVYTKHRHPDNKKWDLYRKTFMIVAGSGFLEGSVVNMFGGLPSGIHLP